MNRIILLLICLLLVEAQIFPLSASANSKYVQSFNDNNFGIATDEIMPGSSNIVIPDNTVEIKQAKNCLNINKGNVLLSPDRDICVGTPEANIYIAAGATIFLMESNNDVVVYDLYQNRPKQITVVVEKTKLFMEPGRMLVLTKQNTQSFKNLNVNCHSINYRRPHQVDLHNEAIKAFTADFSILSAMARIQPLKQLTISEDKKDKLVLDRILKSALVLSSFNAAAP